MKKCESCGVSFIPSKYNINSQKYCNSCRETKKKERYRNWYKRKGKEYIRIYMTTYFKTLFLFCMCVLSIGWSEQKTKLGIQDFDGNIGFSTTITKPPSYQLNLGKYAGQYLSMNKFAFKKKPIEQEEEQTSMSFYEPKERLSWGIEYGVTSNMTEISLLDIGSVTGWKVLLGNVSEILWGRNEYGDKTASFSINSEYFNFITFKAFGTPETQEQIFFEDEKKPVTPFSPKPLTKREGGAFMFPYSFKESRGFIEFGVIKRYDEILKTDTKGYTFNTSLDAPNFRTSLRFIDKGFESQSRTIDYSVSGKYNIEILDNLELRAGYKLLSYTDQPLKHNATAGFSKIILGVNTNAEARYNFFDKSLGLTYNLSGKVKDLFNISSSRTENYTATSTSENTSLSISRKEGNISGNYGKNQYRKNITHNSGVNINLNIEGFSLGGGISISESITPNSYKYLMGTSYNFKYKLTSISGSFNPSYQRISLNREIPLDKYGKGIGLGISYNNTPNTQSITSSINYSW